MEIKLEGTNNGWIVEVTDSTKKGKYVYDSVNEYKMLEFIGKIVTSTTVKVERR